jgi:hypothetical protein
MRSTSVVARRVECEPSVRALELIWRMFIAASYRDW